MSEPVLVKLSESMLVHPSEIRRVCRNGNYTDVMLMDGRLHQLWDEDMIIWYAIENSSL